MTSPFSLFLPTSLLSYLAVLTAVEAEPIAATWSSDTFGPDGPWRAVEVRVGSEQTISMFPGGEWTSSILTSEYCTYNKSISCDAARAGLYNKQQSELGGSGSDALIQWQPGKNFMSGLDVTGDDLTMWVDDMDIGGQTVENVSMALLGENFAQYPGRWSPLGASCLSLGAKDINQTFTMGDAPAVNASLISGYLWSQGTTASNSFGMHIGSANPLMDGSLYFGGYDQNRVIGDVVSGSGSVHGAIDLKDISIKVVDGASPWDSDSIDGLLGEGNSSIPSAGIQVSVDGCSPYLTLPKSTCDAIAAHLPVEYDQDLGLYLWQTDSAKYQQIVPSASVLQFTFPSGSNTRSVAISVPFRHLNLTLDASLLDGGAARPYFPCFTGSERYALGRAFLQDAFLGANYGADTWWLAQAPGPNVPLSPKVVELAEGDAAIQASANDWKESWSGSWKALSASDVNSNGTSSDSNSGDGDSTGQSGSGSGAAIGIGVGVGVGAVAIIGFAAFFLIRRRRRNSAAEAAGEESGSSSGGAPNMSVGTPQNGWYQPVKTGDATSPGMMAPAPYSPGQQPPYYAQELAAVGNSPPSELPGSQGYEPQLIGIHAPQTPEQQQQQLYTQQQQQYPQQQYAVPRPQSPQQLQ